MASDKELYLYNGTVKVKFTEGNHAYYISRLENGEWSKAVRGTGVTTHLGIINKSEQLVPWAIDLYKEYLLKHLDEGITEAHIEEGSKQHTIVKDTSANLGTLIHAWIEAYIWHKLLPFKFLHPEMPEDRNVTRGVLSFLDWVDRDKVQFKWSEKIVYSLIHGYIGTGDFGCDAQPQWSRKVLSLFGDTKTGNGMYAAVKGQTASYLKADVEESGAHYDGRVALRISKETEAEYMARMQEKLAKGKIKKIPPYKIFEAIYLDKNDPTALDRDFQGYLHSKGLYEWHKLAAKELEALKAEELEKVLA